MKQILLSLVVAAAVVLSSVVTAEQAPVQETSAPTQVAPAKAQREGFNIFKAFRKGGRGLANIAFSPLEIPNQMVKEAKRHDTVGGAAAGYLTGIPVGCGWMLYRLGVGVFDFVTGPIPIPTYEKSYIEPEYLFSQDPYPQ